MEEGVGVVEYVPLADTGVVVVCAEGIKCPIGDVLCAVAAVFVIGVERKRLCFLSLTLE